MRNQQKKDSKRIREAIARDAERKKKALGLGEFNFGGKRARVFFAVALLAFAGILLISRAKPKSSKQTLVRTRAETTSRDLHILSIALNMFRDDCGRYPTTEEGLWALISNPGITNWPKPYVTLIRPDPWQQNYIYASSNETFSLYSSGPDRLANTGDDIFPPAPAETQDQEAALTPSPSATN
jgi:general secretion pathway protein G